MIPGGVLDAAAWLGAACALAAAVAAVVERERTALSTMVPGFLAAAAAIAVGLVVHLAMAFLAVDLSYEYVFFYTGTEVAWPWRLAGTWAGREGSFLLWTAFLAVATLAFASQRAARKPRDAGAATKDTSPARAHSWTVAILALLLAAFLVAVASEQSPFAATDPDLLEGRPMGNGINPTLKSAFILIHPPVMFAAYAVATVPFAAALAHVATGTGRWSRQTLTWTRLGWLLMTGALGLGAIWAYYTLGFGGYWAWDPVEVANLLPWLAFTLLLHAQVQHARRGAYPSMGPFLAALPFLLSVFSTVSTRSGLWVSVHAFTDPRETFNADAAARFLDILAAEPTLRFHVATLAAGFAAFLALWCVRLARDHGRLRRASLAIASVLGAFAVYALLAPRSAMSALLEASHRATGSAGLGLVAFGVLAVVAAAAPLLLAGEPAPREGRPRTNRRWRLDRTHLAGYAILGLGLALTVLFLLHAAAAQQGTSARFYEERLPWMALPILVGVLLFQGSEALGRRRAVMVAVGVALAAVAAYLALRQAGQVRLGQGALLLLPAFAVACVGFLRIVKATHPETGARRLRVADGAFLAAALLDLLFWLNPPTVRLGAWAWTPQWPAQAFFGGAAAVVLVQAVRLAAGSQRPRAAVAGLHVAAAALGGFYVAPLLAAASWWLRSRAAGGTPRAAVDGAALRTRLHETGVHAIHLALALALVGYAASTYGKAEADVELALGDGAALGGTVLAFRGATMEHAEARPAESVAATFDVVRSGATLGPVSSPLSWEERAGAYYPLPGTLRRATGDIYVDVTAVHIAAGSPCLPSTDPDGAWLEAYRAGAPSRVCGADRIDAVRAHAVSLPGLGLLWLALAIGLAGMAALMLQGKDGNVRPDGGPDSHA